MLSRYELAVGGLLSRPTESRPSAPGSEMVGEKDAVGGGCAVRRRPGSTGPPAREREQVVLAAGVDLE